MTSAASRNAGKWCSFARRHFDALTAAGEKNAEDAEDAENAEGGRRQVITLMLVEMSVRPGRL